MKIVVSILMLAVLGFSDNLENNPDRASGDYTFIEGSLSIGQTSQANYPLDVNGTIFSPFIIGGKAIVTGDDSLNAAIFGSNSSSRSIYINIDGSNQRADLHIDTSGRIGMGTDSAEYHLHLKSEDPLIMLEDSDGGDKMTIGNAYGNFYIRNTTDNKTYLVIDSSGNSAFTGSLKVKSLWADHVFKADHNLPPLESVEAFIDENKRLPGMRSEAYILKNGQDVGETNVKLLEKIEELTLYTIQLHKRLKEVEAR